MARRDFALLRSHKVTPADTALLETLGDRALTALERQRSALLLALAVAARVPADTFSDEERAALAELPRVLEQTERFLVDTRHRFGRT